MSTETVRAVNPLEGSTVTIELASDGIYVAWYRDREEQVVSDAASTPFSAINKLVKANDRAMGGHKVQSLHVLYCDPDDAEVDFRSVVLERRGPSQWTIAGAPPDFVSSPGGCLRFHLRVMKWTDGAVAGSADGSLEEGIQDLQCAAEAARDMLVDVAHAFHATLMGAEPRVREELLRRGGDCSTMVCHPEGGRMVRVFVAIAPEVDLGPGLETMTLEVGRWYVETRRFVAGPFALMSHAVGFALEVTKPGN